MILTDLTPASAVFAHVRAGSKKSLLQDLAQKMGPLVGADPRDLFAALLERERLGSTGMGRGVAIPHCRMPNVDKIVGGLALLETPIDFEAVDGEAVDLVYVLVAPECAGSDHLKALARISRVLRDQSICKALRGAKDEAALYAILSQQEQAAIRAA